MKFEYTDIFIQEALLVAEDTVKLTFFYALDQLFLAKSSTLRAIYRTSL
jgi:hypothetical protein